MFKGYIYLIYNEVNNELYVGLTEGTIEDRFYQHKVKAKNGGYGDKNLLYPNMRKVGINECKITCLEVYDYDGEDVDYFRNNLKKMEEKWMIRLKPSLNVITPYFNKNNRISENLNQIINENLNQIIEASKEIFTEPIINFVKDNYDDYDVLQKYSSISYIHKFSGDILQFEVNDIVYLKSNAFYNHTTSYYIITKIRSNSIVCKKINEDKSVESNTNYVKYNDFFKNVEHKIKKLT